VLAEALERSAGDPLLGVLVLARFVLLGPRGFGGRATAYDAVDIERGDRCVVKVVRDDDGVERAIARVEHEAKLLSAAPAGRVPSLRASGRHEIAAADPALPPARFACLAMDSAPGGSLATLELPADEGLAVARSLLETIAALHGAGVIHGDITPAHAFLAPDGSVRLVDLEHGRLKTDAGVVEGDAATPAFAAPERVFGPSERADLFSWGRVIERCVGDRAPADLTAAIRAALEPDASHRAGSAAALLGTLARR
jgi:serine/threonine protein kinase